jgi:hypothetical protein
VAPKRCKAAEFHTCRLWIIFGRELFRTQVEQRDFGHLISFGSSAPRLSAIRSLSSALDVVFPTELGVSFRFGFNLGEKTSANGVVVCRAQCCTVTVYIFRADGPGHRSEVLRLVVVTIAQIVNEYVEGCELLRVAVKLAMFVILISAGNAVGIIGGSACATSAGRHGLPE